jgi:hypothetical protein
MAGTLLGGFVLIEFLGLRLTSYVAVGLNLLAGVGARLLSRRWESSQPGTASPAGPAGRPPRPRVPRSFLPRRRAVLAATFVSGFVALGLEVLWTRMLAEGTGSSIYIFTAILAIFLLGIALGSALYRRLSRPRDERLGTLGACLAGVGVLAQATVVLGSGVVGQVPFFVRTVVVLLPATVLMGYAFPLAGRLATPTAEAAGGSLVVASATGYRRRLPVADAGTLLLATRLAGRPLSAGHGFPARLVAPGRRGFWWVKWVVSVEVDPAPWWRQPPFPLT